MSSLVGVTRRRRSPFAQRLFEHRKLERRLTQVEYAAELKIHPISLSRYELDKSPVGDEWLAQELFRVTGIMPPRTNAELSELVEGADAETSGRDEKREAGRAAAAKASGAGTPRVPRRPKRRPNGREHG